MKVGDNYWKSNIPLAVREGAQQRIDEALRKHPDIRPSDLASPRSKLDFVNVMDYRTIIENGSNWLFFEAIFRRKQDLANHLESFSEYRNTVMHSRAMTELVRLKGDAAMIWFENVLPAQNQIATTDDSEEEDEEENGDE